MAKVTITGGSITIEFGAWERFFTGRARHVVPLAAVRQARVAERPVAVPRGARKGLTVSGYTKIGVWGLFGGPRQLASVRHDVPGLHLLLAGDEFDEVVVSTPDAARLVRAVEAASVRAAEN